MVDQDGKVLFFAAPVDQDGKALFFAAPVDQDGIFGIFLSTRMSIRMDNASGTGVVPFSYLIIWRVEISRNAPSVF